MSDAAVIPAAYVKLSTMVDGTIRVVIDVEPTNRDAAFALFDRPGASLAIARLSDGAAVEHDRKAQAQPPAELLKRKPLSLASKVALVCDEVSFQRFLQTGLYARRWSFWRDHAAGWTKPALWSDIAALVIREICGVTSRSEITPGSDAERIWRSVEADYHDWQRTGAAA
jgi:hypothetical protein